MKYDPWLLEGTMLDYNAIGKRIRELRKARGLTQSAFAEALRVSFQAVSNWERGVAPPELDNLVRIAEYFGVLVDDLLRSSEERLILGVDGGGTKTEFVVATEKGSVLKRFCLAGSNPNDIGIKKTVELLCDGIRETMKEYSSIRSVFCGISGASVGGNRIKIIEALAERYPTLLVDVDTDSANLFALYDDVDMVVISGTGSVVFVREKDRLVRVGGWGNLIDSGGSAFDIGRDALRLALEEEDSLDVPSPVTKLLREKLAVTAVWDAVGRIYAEGKPFIASLADVVFRAFEAGDEKAASIILRNAEVLARLLRISVERHGACPRAVVGGGIFEHYGDIMIPNIQKFVSVELLRSELPPIYGACRRALFRISDGVTDEFFENFKNSYRGVK